MESDDLCARCMQPVPAEATRCPHCATPHRRARRMSLWLGTGIAIAVAFVIALMIYAIRQDDLMQAPAEGTEQSVPARPEPPPPLNK